MEGTGGVIDDIVCVQDRHACPHERDACVQDTCGCVERGRDVIDEDDRRGQCVAECVQGYLAMGVLGGWAFSYERGTTVCT